MSEQDGYRWVEIGEVLLPSDEWESYGGVWKLTDCAGEQCKAKRSYRRRTTEPTRPASPALDRLKEEIEKAPHSAGCDFYIAPGYVRIGVPERPLVCECWQRRALRIIEELKQ